MTSAQEFQDNIVKDWTRRGKFWNSRADEIARSAAMFNAALIDAAEILPGQTILDLATGAGEPALALAQLVGIDGHVYATDLVPEMLDGAIRRADERDIQNITFRIADMAKLPDKDNFFDRVVCRFGLMFVSEPSAAAKEACRVLKPGGLAAYLVWGPRENTTMFAVIDAAANTVFDDGSKSVTSCRERFGEDGKLEAALVSGGFETVEERDVFFTPKVAAGRDFWRAQLDMSYGAKLEKATQSQCDALDQEIRNGMEQHRLGDHYQLHAHVKLGIAKKAV